MPATPPSEAPSPTSTLPLPEPELRQGSQGAGVRQLQAVLLRLRYLGGRADGDFGPATARALQGFQRDWHLAVDGVYAEGTRAALQKALVPVSKPPTAFWASPNFGSRGGTPIDTLILHHTASNDAAKDLATLRYTKTDNRVSAHYLVVPTGKLYQLVPDSKEAWHAGVASLRGVTHPSVNARSLGIEITNDGAGTPFTEAQYRTLEQLVPYLARTYHVPKENLLGHRDVAPGRKTDPADYFDWARVRRAVDAVL